ncbi:hypothetical protein Bealeia1_00006 [Candidatus Bealeia paramacronuclearis]|uniref:Uncharacterized protein n=1 Tax=Candidatus Bealeia paramacronuclearis TaxID=1921001 RepID=A0ABZ2C212_9PROT|nr:hypothetical protein [Candidatus Bealeia paramacronuclearis]
MNKLIKVILVLGCFSVCHAKATGAYSVGDEHQDSNIELKYIPNYILVKYKKMSKELEEIISSFDYNNKEDFIFVDHPIQKNILLKVDHIAEDDKNNDFFLKRLRDDLRKTYNTLRDKDFFHITSTKFRLVFNLTIPQSLAVFYNQVASDLSLNYMEIIKLRKYILSISGSENETGRAIYYAVFLSRKKIVEDLSDVIHALRPHVLRSKMNFSEIDIQQTLEATEKGLKKISEAERQYCIETAQIAQKAFSSLEGQEILKKLQNK